jgi:amidohydrolase
MSEDWLDRWLESHGHEIVAARRRLHASPELGYREFLTTEYLAERMALAGLAPQVFPGGCGVMCDIGPGAGDPSWVGPTVALRADIDALPLDDVKDVPYRSTVPGVCHACGHDAHAAVVLGAALALAGVDLPGRVRIVFQPAEETLPSGSLHAIESGVLAGVDCIFALHCDARLEVGSFGIRPGPITSASDRVEVRLSGPGGHTSRPNLTVDLVYALAKVVTDVPALLSRRVDPRSGMSLVWGAIRAGSTANAIPGSGSVIGTLRVLDPESWQGASEMVRRLVHDVAMPLGAVPEVDYTAGVPPVVNDPEATDIMRKAAEAALGRGRVVTVPQSLGGEDFAYYLDQVPGALGRLGVQRPGEPPLDLHQPSFDIDEGALEVGVRVMVSTALAALRARAADDAARAGSDLPDSELLQAE